MNVLPLISTAINLLSGQSPAQPKATEGMESFGSVLGKKMEPTAAPRAELSPIQQLLQSRGISSTEGLNRSVQELRGELLNGLKTQLAANGIDANSARLELHQNSLGQLSVHADGREVLQLNAGSEQSEQARQLLQLERLSQHTEVSGRGEALPMLALSMPAAQLQGPLQTALC